MFHLAAFTGALGQTANTSIAALADDILQRGSVGFLPQKSYDLVACCAMSPTLVRARLNSGTIRQVNPSYIRPLNGAAVPGNNPNVQWLEDEPFRIQGQEELTCEATATLATGTEQFTAFLWLQTGGFIPVPPGRIYVFRATSTTAAVANAWSTIVPTLETGIPAGVYSVVDVTHQSANAQAVRCIFDNAFERPGTLSLTALASRKFWRLGEYGLGAWGQFYSYSLPRFQVLCNGADASHELYIHAVKLPGSAPMPTP